MPLRRTVQLVLPSFARSFSSDACYNEIRDLICAVRLCCVLSPNEGWPMKINYFAILKPLRFEIKKFGWSDANMPSL
jgi:hypothetical protein